MHWRYMASSMEKETIIEVRLTDKNELLLNIDSDGNPMYQYIYREAAGVYWDTDNKGFKSTPINDRTISEWFFHITGTVKSGLNIDLALSEKAFWGNIPDAEKDEIINAI